MDDISIAIVVYNDEPDVRRAVESIEIYTDKAIQKTVYLIDNSTKENKLHQLEEQYQDVCYIKTGANLGFGGGQNFVIPKLNSRLHAIVNPDIRLDSDAISALISFMQDTSIGMCVPRLLYENGKMIKAYRRDLTIWDMFLRMFLPNMFRKRQAFHTMQDMDYRRPFQVPFAQGSFLVIRTELFKKIGGFDERYFLYMEDADLCKRVNEISALWYCPYASVIHKWEKGSHKKIELFQIHLRSMWAYFKKWGWKFI